MIETDVRGNHWTTIPRGLVIGARRGLETLATMRKTRWAILGVVACLGALVSGWTGSRLEQGYQAEAFFDCRCLNWDGSPSPESPPAVRQAPASDAMLAGVLERIAGFHADVTCDSIRQGLSVQERAIETGSRRVVIRVRQESPSVAQGLALAIAGQYVGSAVATDPARNALRQLSQAETAFQCADRLWENALAHEVETGLNPSTLQLQGSCDVAMSTPAAMPTVPVIRPVTSADEPSLAEQAIQHCRQQRQRIAETYTERHPAVASLDSQIRQLEAELGADSPTAKGPDSRIDDHVQPTSMQFGQKRQENPPEKRTAASIDECRRSRSAALGKLSLAQQQFERVADSAVLVAYTAPALGDLRAFGTSRVAWFRAGLGITVGLIIVIELVFISLGRRRALPTV